MDAKKIFEILLDLIADQEELKIEYEVHKINEKVSNS
jgi:hypothetical protein